MKLKTIFLFTVNLLVVPFNAQAICIKNETNFPLYYEIHNQNMRCPIPRIKLHTGIVNKNDKKCHAHTTDDPDWTIFRFDQINIFKIDENGTQIPVCNKEVQGILNTLNVSYFEFDNSWWCLDRSDYEDLKNR